MERAFVEASEMAELSITGPGQYNDVVVEVDFSPAFTAIVRMEHDKFFIEVFNFSASQLDDFADGRRVARNSVELDDFLRMIGEAKELLRYQAG